MAAPGNGAPRGSGSNDFYRGEQIGKYEILTQLSLGGMAELFLGFTSGPGGFRKYVVIKRVLPDVRNNEQFERMFLDEARITAAFNHPNIAQVYDLGQEDEGLYLAMEFIAGQNLNQVSAACFRRQETVPMGFSLAVARDVCLALHYAHTFTDPTGKPASVIHRDVAQKNVMVTYDGVVKLLDFGIAKARGKLQRTVVGTVKGTTGYMSPEQVRGEGLDGRSDVFSVGVMLHELLTGERLFSGRDEREEMVKIVQAPIPRPIERAPHVPEDVSSLVMKALERNPAERFPTAKDMAKAIETVAGKLLFDNEQRAAFMREMFETRMKATRTLLESAGERDTTLFVETAVRAMKADDGGVFPERGAKLRPSRIDTQGERPTRGGDEEEALPPPTLALELTDSSVDPSNRISGAIWVVLIFLVLLGGGFAVMNLTKSLDAQVKPEETLKPFTGGPQLPEFQEPGKAPPPKPAGTAAATPPTAPATPGTPTRAAPDENRDTGSAGGGRGAQGALTLVVQPEAEVFRGNRSLGNTPLFSVALPAGKHRLRIVGADGKNRVLSVPITAGKTSKFRLELDAIPLE
ncbi:serine/threonine protein kinase [Myxococcaceae bacterium GXIMD 01537]